MLWLSLICPDFPLQALARGQNATEALAVAHKVGSAPRILAANAAAQALGVHPGLGLASAQALAPEVRILTRELRAEADAMTELALWAGQFTSQVVIDPPQGLLLEVAGSRRLFGGLATLCVRILRGSEHLGFTLRHACAPTPLAARWLARTDPGRIVSTHAALQAAVSALPLQAIECAPAIHGLLDSIGARRIADVLRLPRAGLARRGATELLQALDRALGEVPDPRSCFEPPPMFSSRIELLYPQHEAESLLLIVRRLLESLSGYLALRHAAVERFRFMLEHEDQQDTELDIVLGSASRDATRLLGVTREHFARLALPAPVTALRLHADHLQEQAARTDSLFADPLREAEDRVQLVDRLRARLGHEAVSGLGVCADHRPEHAFAHSEPGRPMPVTATRGQRPLWLLRTPQALRGVGAHSQQPWLEGALQLLAGPERIEAGWWDDEDDSAAPADTLRDYYVARAADARTLWIYRELRPPYAWFLHGVFA